MKRVILYESNDGERFNTEVECLKRDTELESIAECMSLLKPIITVDDFRLGKMYIPQDKKRVELALRQLNSLLPAELQVKQETVFNYRRGIIYRWLTDSGDYKHFAKAWNRFYCMDSNYREWYQLSDALRSDDLI
jgi:hypothetical protein